MGSQEWQMGAREGSKHLDGQAEYSILILEDSSEDFEILRREISNLGVRLKLTRVVTKSEFLQCLSTSRPDLIISDFKLPSWDGLSALEVARQKFPDVPFLVVSGYINDNFAALLLKAGAADFLLKDRLARLESSVEKLLAQSKVHDLLHSEVVES